MYLGKTFTIIQTKNRKEESVHFSVFCSFSCDKCAYPPITLIGAEQNGYFITVLLK